MGSKSSNSTSTSYTTNYDYTVGNVGLTGADAVNYAATLGNTLVTLEQGANMTAADALAAAGSTVPGTTTGSVVPASAGTGSAAPASGTNWTMVIVVAAIGLVVVGGVILFLGRDKK